MSNALKPILSFLFFLGFLFWGQLSVAQVDHQLIRRMVVFPMKTDLATASGASGSQSGINSAAVDDVWWQVREELTRTRRALIASKQFLVKSDVFQPRGELEPADAIILGKLLDAHALITMQLIERKLTMRVYDGGNGLMLWTKSANLHPSLTVADQLSNLAKKMVNDFMSSIPYQGFTVIDTLIGQPVYEEGDVRLAQVDFGLSTGVQIGDLVQWIRVVSTTTAPLFQGGSKMIIFAEGKVVRLEQGVATIEILRATSLKEIREYTLVRVPREAERLITENTISDTPRTTLTPELAAPELSPMEQVKKEKRPLAMTLSIIGSLAAFLLLAF